MSKNLHDIERTAPYTAAVVGQHVIRPVFYVEADGTTWDTLDEAIDHVETDIAAERPPDMGYWVDEYGEPAA